MMNPEELPYTPTDYRSFKAFNFFYYTVQDNKLYFLLRKRATSDEYCELRGHVKDEDPDILFAAARKLVRISRGLFSKQNLIRFSERILKANEFCKTDVCDKKSELPCMMNNPCYQRFLEDAFHYSIQYENESDSVFYFLEIENMVNLDIFHKNLDPKKTGLQLKYFSLEEMLEEKENKISAETKKLFDKNLTEFVEDHFRDKKEIPITRKFALLVINTTPTNYRVMGLFASSIKKRGEFWKVYNFPNEKPSIDDLKTFDALIIPGANICAYDKALDFRKSILDIIRETYECCPKCKIFGICYGIQIIAEALGGECTKLDDEKQGYGSAKLQLSEDFWSMPYTKNIPKKSSELYIVESHRDKVRCCPQKAKIFGYSDVSEVEILGIGDRCLAFQGHPEINEPYAACLFFNCAKSKNQDLTFDDYLKNNIPTLFPKALEHETWMKIVYNFLKMPVSLENEESLQNGSSPSTMSSFHSE